MHHRCGKILDRCHIGIVRGLFSPGKVQLISRMAPRASDRSDRRDFQRPLPRRAHLRARAQSGRRRPPAPPPDFRLVGVLINASEPDVRFQGTIGHRKATLKRSKMTQGGHQPSQIPRRSSLLPRRDVLSLLGQTDRSGRRLQCSLLAAPA